MRGCRTRRWSPSCSCRLRFDLAVARHALASGLPLPAACRGLQVDSRSSTSLWAGRCARIWAARRWATGVAYTASRSRRGRWRPRRWRGQGRRPGPRQRPRQGLRKPQGKPTRWRSRAVTTSAWAGWATGSRSPGARRTAPSKPSNYRPPAPGSRRFSGTPRTRRPPTPGSRDCSARWWRRVGGGLPDRRRRAGGRDARGHRLSSAKSGVRCAADGGRRRRGGRAAAPPRSPPSASRSSAADRPASRTPRRSAARRRTPPPR